MYFLWIDPWVRKLWFAIINHNLKIEDAWILLQDTVKPTRIQYFQKIIKIKDFFDDLLKKYSIEACAIEKLFFTKFNQANAEFVYWIRAVLITLILEKNIKLLEFTPIELKKFITWNWKAQKTLVQHTIQNLFNLENLPNFDDSADALWLAYLAYKFTK